MADGVRTTDGDRMREYAQRVFDVFGTSLRLLLMCLREAPEFAARRRTREALR